MVEVQALSSLAGSVSVYHPGVYSGSSTSLVRVLWICLSLMCGASIGRIFPRSRRRKWAPGFGRHVPEMTSRRRRAVPENRCRSKFCVDCFHLTLLQHFFPHLNIFRKLNAWSIPPRASFRIRRRSSRAAFSSMVSRLAALLTGHIFYSRLRAVLV